MAVVADLSGNFPASLPSGLDQRMSQYNRTNAGNPRGSLTPSYSGEIVLDTVSIQLYRAVGTTNNDWTPVIVTG